MGKIRVADLARMMGIPDQDLMFKLKSIGVRVDDDDAKIDSDVIQAILEGKRLPSPREVILRDGEAQPATTTPVRRRPPARRVPPNLLRHSRRRTIIQKVEPRIKTIPVSDRPGPAAAPPEAPDKAAEKAPDKAAQAPAAEAPAQAKTRERPARPLEPRRERDDKKSKRLRPEPEDEDLRAYRGSVDGIYDEADEPSEAAVASTRRRRRVQRKKREAESGAKVLAFKQAPSGEVTVSEGMTVRDFADKLGIKAKDLIKVLFEHGTMATINHVVEPELAQKIAQELGVEARQVSFEEEVQIEQEKALAEESPEATVTRAPVITIMGHVDHGKTTLLDTIRSSKITEQEFGGITQHIGAYQVEADGRKVVFLDTPGHEAFTLMRARGARATDIVVLVVAADDGVMPQTLEAIDHAKAAEVPIIVAINKIDKPNANPDRVKKELSENGLLVESWGGETISVELSAKTGDGIPNLLEMLLLSADLLELKSNPELPAQGVVIEARKEVGRGILATVLVQDGTLRVGDVFVSGATWGRVRSMNDDLGQRVEEAEPATPVEVTGLSDLPEAGDPFQVVEDEAKARNIADFRSQQLKRRALASGQGKLSLDQLFSQIQEGRVKELPLVLKADVQGSVEVLRRETLAKLSTEQVKIQVIHAGVGAVTTNDILLASASGAIVVGFNVRPERNAAELAEKEQVEIRLHTVIYELADEIRGAMTGLLEPTFREVIAGRAEVREIFNLPRHGTVAGCHVVEGAIPRNAAARLLRDNVVVHDGKIASLRRFKEDIAEVRAGFDCGIRLERFQDVKPGDTIEAYVQEEVAPTL